MMKNDITYEYRVFTNRLVDVGSMEVGRCTSKVINKLKSKDKVDGRFFHTSDTDEWFFCWNGELQKLNLKGGADVNSALEKAEKLIEEAKSAADKASDAVESIGNKADKSEVEAVAKEVAAKADASVVKELSDKVAEIDFSEYATKEYVGTQVDKKQDKIEDLDAIRSGAAAGATALQEVPVEYVTEDELTAKDYATETFVNEKIAEIVIPEVPSMDNYYTKSVIDTKIEDINRLIGDANEYITNTILA